MNKASEDPAFVKGLTRRRNVNKPMSLLYIYWKRKGWLTHITLHHEFLKYRVLTPVWHRTCVREGENAAMKAP